MVQRLYIYEHNYIFRVWYGVESFRIGMREAYYSACMHYKIANATVKAITAAQVTTILKSESTMHYKVRYYYNNVCMTLASSRLFVAVIQCCSFLFGRYGAFLISDHFVTELHGWGWGGCFLSVTAVAAKHHLYRCPDSRANRPQDNECSKWG